MKLEDVHNIAKSLGVHPGKLSKSKLIKTLQTGSVGCLCLRLYR